MKNTIFEILYPCLILKAEAKVKRYEEYVRDKRTDERLSRIKKKKKDSILKYKFDPFYTKKAQ